MKVSGAIYSRVPQSVCKVIEVFSSNEVDILKSINLTSSPTIKKFAGFKS